MNKKMLQITLVFLTVVTVGSAYLLLGDGGKKAMNQVIVNNSSEQDAESPSTSVSGAYIDYKDDVLASTDGIKLLFFHAPWCPQCRALEADIKEKGVPDGVTIIKVDYDTSQNLREKYGVTLQTTIVRVDDEGKLVRKFVVYNDPSLESVKNNLL